jgi:glycosyltransferase involved in cell wall biosynthesis
MDLRRLKASVTISAPYPEGAIMHLANGFSISGELGDLWAPSRAPLRRLAGALDVTSPGLGARLTRGSGRIAELREVAPSLEMGRLLARMAPGELIFSRYTSYMKRSFDRMVDQRAKTTGTIIGMPESSLATFRSRPDAVKVMHHVDAHPKYHNEALINFYGPLSARRELYPTKMVDQIEAELGLADQILVPSEIVKNQMISNGISEKKLLKIPYGVDMQAFDPTSHRRSTNRRPLIIYVGQISLRKGIPFLLEAIKNQPYDVKVVGPLWPGMPMPRWPANVTYLGVLPQPALAAELSQADAYVFPSIEDNFALSVLEAAAAGLPIITTTAVGSSEFLSDRIAVKLPPGDVSALREALRRIGPLSSEERYEHAMEVRQSAWRTNSWNDYVDEVRTALGMSSSNLLGLKTRKAQ